MYVLPSHETHSAGAAHCAIGIGSREISPFMRDTVKIRCLDKWVIPVPCHRRMMLVAADYQDVGMLTTHAGWVWICDCRIFHDFTSVESVMFECMSINQDLYLSAAVVIPGVL